MDAELEKYRATALAELAAAQSSAELETWYRAHLGMSGQVTAWKKQIGKRPAEQRREFGGQVNQVGEAITAAHATRQRELAEAELAQRLATETIDVTVSPNRRQMGGYHPVTLAIRDLTTIFAGMGFIVFESPDVELDEFNFQYLNIPAHHPARDMQDTFYVATGPGQPAAVLRTHTSAGQIRAMRKFHPAPIQVILPGCCYRNEAISARSEIQFHQIEGLLVGPHVRMSDLKGILLRFSRQMFGPEQDVRVRGSYFPFTEPSVEVDIKCTLCSGTGCRLCKYSGWLELLGAGLVHPVVLENGGYDPQTVRGIAFGIGVERLVLLRYGIKDIRYFCQNDLRFLRQFV